MISIYKIKKRKLFLFLAMPAMDNKIIMSENPITSIYSL